jgi:AraC-like DNA-binding protein
MHLVFRWSEQPLVVRYDAENKNPIQLSDSLIGGARENSYLRQLSERSHSVGALLLPGTATLLFGVRADELSERHTALEDLWSKREVAELRERLAEADDAEARVHILEVALLRRLPQVHGLHPAVAEALSKLARRAPVKSVVEESGYSHRRLLSLFRDAVGLSPKVFARLTRLQRALEHISCGTCPSLAEVAVHAGYADQSHFTREFRRIAGVSPRYYRITCSGGSNHVPVNAPE